MNCLVAVTFAVALSTGEVESNFNEADVIISEKQQVQSICPAAFLSSPIPHLRGRPPLLVSRELAHLPLSLASVLRELQ